jgi:hypothetical protein
MKRPVRRSALISPWGVGALINFPADESLMTCGLDVWPYPAGPDLAEFQVFEERLQARLEVDHFRLPHDYRMAAWGISVRHAGRMIPCVRFPRWHSCPNCGVMKQLALFGDRERCPAPPFDRGLSCHERPEYRRPWLLPMRFLAACKEGHIQDFPFMEWTHRDKPITQTCRLRLRAGRSSSMLSGIAIECSCDERVTMAGAFNPGALEKIQKCFGARPWLGETPGQHPRSCAAPLHVLQRGSANVYTPHVVGSIYLPPVTIAGNREIIEALEDPSLWRYLSQGLIDGQIDPVRCEGIATLRRLDAQTLRQAAQARLQGTAAAPTVTAGQSEEEYRQAEFRVFRQGGGDDRVDLFAVPQPITDYDTLIQRYFQTVVLVRKLRETRALVGFSRIVPEDARTAQQRRRDLSRASLNWLPATVVRGEGIFLELRADALEAWENIPALQRRLQLLAGPYNHKRAERGQHQRSIPARFVLLHTLAHLLINQLSYDCGYGSSSLRERLYCQQEYSEPMHGLLIYTASGDSEGTCGGLVRQGEPGRLENTLRRALRKALWCSTDPVCMDSGGQGPDSCNLAACHYCALLPETSCEEQNRLLDRAVVVGMPEKPSLGFFAEDKL